MSLLTPQSSAIFVAGLFAVTACPPFGPFFSELRVIRAAFETHHGGVAMMFLACLLFAFFGLTRLVFAIVDGRPRPASIVATKLFPESARVVLPPLLLLGFSLWLGLSMPAVLPESWAAAVAQLYPTP